MTFMNIDTMVECRSSSGLAIHPPSRLDLGTAIGSHWCGSSKSVKRELIEK